MKVLPNFVYSILSFIGSNRKIILIFLFVFSGYLINLPRDYSKSISTKVTRRLLTSNDVTAATFLPYEIITNGTLYFSSDTVKAMDRAQGNSSDVYAVINYKGRFFSAMPILSGILALPLYLLPIILNKIPSLQYYENLLKILILGRIAASFYTSLSAAIFYLILKEIDKLKNFKSDKWIYLFLMFFAFGTNVYSIASRALWQHTSSLLFVTLIIYFLLKSLNDERYVKFLGLFAGLLYLARPLNIVLVVLLTGYVFFRYKEHFLKYLLYGATIAILLFSYNAYSWGNPFTTEYVVKNDTKFSTPLLRGLKGNLFSPSRSFLFVTPPLVISYYAMFLLFKKKSKKELDVVLTLLSTTYLIVLILYSMWHDWNGGDRFGYGLFTEWVPIVALLTYITIKPLGRFPKIVFAILILWSLLTQFNAVWYRKSRCGKDHNWTFHCLKLNFFSKQYY